MRSSTLLAKWMAAGWLIMAVGGATALSACDDDDEEVDAGNGGGRDAGGDDDDDDDDDDDVGDAGDGEPDAGGEDAGGVDAGEPDAGGTADAGGDAGGVSDGGDADAGDGGGDELIGNVAMTSSDTFSPQTLNVLPGTRIDWLNEDSDAHTVTVDATNQDAGGPNSDDEFPNGVPGGGTWTYSFTVPENAASGTSWYYHCRFHGAAGDGDSLGIGMAGVIVVQ